MLKGIKSRIETDHMQYTIETENVLSYDIFPD